MNTSKRPRRNAQGLDRSTAERMFVGLAADDAPPDYAAVAAVLAAAAAPADESSTAPGEYAAVRAYHDAIYATVPARSRSARRFQPWHTAAGRIAVFATAGALAMGGGVAAAATGSLPAPAQRVAHQILGGLGVPAVTSSAIPANFDHSRGDTDATTASSVTVPQSTRTSGPSTTEVIPAEAPAPAPALAPATTAKTDADDHGKAVSSIAKSADAGAEHGAEVCIVASDGECKNRDRGESHSSHKHRGDTGTEHAAKKHHSDDGADNSSHKHRNHDSTGHSAKDHRSDTGADNSTKDHPTENGDAHSNGSDDGTPEQGATGH